MWIIILISLVVTFVVTFCLQITLEKVQRISHCTNGLIDQNDKFVVKGKVTGDVTDNLAQGWQDKLDIEILTKTSGLVSICDIPLTKALCDPDGTLLCYCSEVNSAKGEVHFVVNHTALAELSQGTIRARWRNNDTTSDYSNNQTLPAIYSMSEAELRLTFYGENGSLKSSGPCSYRVTLNVSNDLTVCCTSPITPCYPQISFKDDFVTNKSCVSYPASEPSSDEVRGNLELTYSLCVQTDHRSEDICTVTYSPAKPRTATTLSPDQAAKDGLILGSTTIPGYTPRLPSEPKTQASIGQVGDNEFLTRFMPGLCLAAISFVITCVYLYCTQYFCVKPVSVENADEGQTTNTRPKGEGAVKEPPGTIFV